MDVLNEGVSIHWCTLILPTLIRSIISQYILVSDLVVEHKPLLSRSNEQRQACTSQYVHINC